MSFLIALQHAFIGYGIRRKCWAEDVYLWWNHDRQALYEVNKLFTIGATAEKKKEGVEWLGQGAILDAAWQGNDWEAI